MNKFSVHFNFFINHTNQSFKLFSFLQMRMTNQNYQKIIKILTWLVSFVIENKKRFLLTFDQKLI